MVAEDARRGTQSEGGKADRAAAAQGAPAMSRKAETRTEADTMGTVEVPADRYWGAQTQRSLEKVVSQGWWRIGKLA